MQKPPVTAPIYIYIYTSRSYLDQILPHHRTIMCTVNLHMEKTPSFWCQSQNTPEPIGRTPRSRSELRSPHGARKRRRARSRSHNTRDLMMGAPLQWCCARSFSSITIQRTWDGSGQVGVGRQQAVVLCLRAQNEDIPEEIRRI